MLSLIPPLKPFKEALLGQVLHFSEKYPSSRVSLRGWGAGTGGKGVHHPYL